MSIFCEMWLHFFPEPKIVIEEEVFEILRIDEPPKIVRPFVYFIAGGFGGICATLVGHPLDTVKTRLQTMPDRIPPVYKGTLDCFLKILNKQGIGGLYKGLGVQLTSAATSYAVSFSGYGLGKSLQEAAGAINTELTAKNYFLAGAFAGIFTTIIMTPGDRVKLMLQVHSAESTEPQMRYEQRCEPKYDGARDVILKLYRKGGIKSIYKGMLMTLMRNIPATGVFYLTYESLKSSMMAHEEDLPLKPYYTVFIGGLSGVTHWIVAMPCDNVKSILQTAPDGKYGGMKDVFKEIYRKHGVLSLYTGLMPVLIRAFPASAACFLGFENCKNVLNYYVK